MIPEGGEAGNDLAPDAERRNTVGDPLVSLWNDFQDRAAQRLKGAALGLIDAPQVLVNLVPRHNCAV